MSEQESNPTPNFDLTLLANFVHQVVNPLNAVAGTLDNLVEGTIKEESRRVQRLNAARAQLEQCITLIRNLAFLAEGVGAVNETVRSKTILPQVIIEAAMYFQEDGKSKNIDIRLKDKVTQNMVYGRPELLRQVLMNIFDNFIKYGKSGCNVEVDQRIQRRTNMAIVEIKGISQYPIERGDLDKMGALGFRGENAKKVIASGTGLGLHICRKIINQHRGELSIRAGAKGDIVFLIKLPAGS